MMLMHSLRTWFQEPNACADRAQHCDDPVHDAALQQARAALRLGRVELAEACLREGSDAVWRDAECLNLLGLIEEARGNWSGARRLWRRSARRNHAYQPPRQNLRRYYELCQFGRTTNGVAFGDEPPTALALLGNMRKMACVCPPDTSAHS